MDHLSDIRARAAELQHRLDEQAPGEATTDRATADKLHALLDDLDNVAELHPGGTEADG